ncbi:hypothetical protein IWW48_002703 [Coemansia sp. RSA 1200]|nr:hypothetical protein IWW48_002703 [Coemansia sp. RSA 1200]
MAEPSQAPVLGVLEAPKTKDKKIDIKSHLSDPRVRKHIYYFLGLSVLAFLPMIFAAISLSFSTPSAGAKVAVYLTTLAAAFLTIGYSAYITRKKIMVVLGHRGDSRIFATEVNIVGTVAEAFTPEQQQYATTADAAHAQEQAALSPTLASQTYNPYGRPSIDQSLNMYPHQQPPRPSQDVGPYPQMPQPMHSPAPATPLPNIPVPLPPAMPMRMPNHLDHQPNRNSRHAGPESDYEYSDDSRVHSFQTVMVRPNEASNRGEQAHNMQYNGNASAAPNAPHQPYQSYNSMILPQLPMVAPAGQLTMPHQSETNGLTNTTTSGQNQVYGNNGDPQSGMHSADASIDDLVVGMLESFHEEEQQSQFVNKNNNNNVSNRSSYRFSHPPPLNMSTESFDYPGQIRDSQFRIANVPSQPDSPISGNFADSREVEDIPTASRTVRRSAIVNFMRKEDAKRKLLAEDTDDDFIDNDSDDGSDAGEQNGNRNQNENQSRDQSVDQNQSQNQGEGEGQRKANWKPTSANLDNLVAQLAKVLIHPDEPTDTLLGNHNNEAKEEGNDDDLDEPDIVYLGSAQASPRRAEQITTPPPQKATVFRRLEHETGSTSSIVDAYSRGSTATLDGADTRIHSMTIRLSANSAASNAASNAATTADSTFVPPAPTPASPAPPLPPTKALPLPPMRAPPPPASNVLPTPSQMLPPPPPSLPDQTQASIELPPRPPPPPALPPQPL